MVRDYAPYDTTIFAYSIIFSKVNVEKYDKIKNKKIKG
jgi:hypothetical protein